MKVSTKNLRRASLALFVVAVAIPLIAYAAPIVAPVDKVITRPVDPTASSGVQAARGAVLTRTGTSEVYVKTTTAPTGWTRVDGGGASTITGAGTAGRCVRWTGAQTQANGACSDDGTNVTFPGTVGVSGTMTTADINSSTGSFTTTLAAGVISATGASAIIRANGANGQLSSGNGGVITNGDVNAGNDGVGGLYTGGTSGDIFLQGATARFLVGGSSTATTPVITKVTAAPSTSAFFAASLAMRSDVGKLYLNTSDNTAANNWSQVVAMEDVFTSTLAGIVPTSSGHSASTDCLKGDGTWGACGGTSTFSGASVTHSADQSISSSTLTTITYNTEEYDTDSYHDTSSNTGRMTAPTTAYYQVQVSVYWDANVVGVREIDLVKNGSTTVAVEAGGDEGGVPRITSMVVTLSLTAGDYIEAKAYQTKGVAVLLKNASYTKYQIQRLGT